MANNTRIRTRKQGARTEILVMVKHPMGSASTEEGQAKARLIEEMTYFLNGEVVAIAQFGGGIARNPLTGVSVAGTNAGDTVAVSWTDSGGQQGGAETTVK